MLSDNTDVVLWWAYAACFLFCLVCGRQMWKAALLTLIGATSVFVLAELMASLSVSPEWFHLIIGAACGYWAYATVRLSGAIFVAIAISVMGILQIAFSVDSFIYQQQMTALFSSYKAIAICLHITIMLATLTNGLTFHSGAERSDSGRGAAL